MLTGMQIVSCIYKRLCIYNRSLTSSLLSKFLLLLVNVNFHVLLVVAVNMADGTVPYNIVL